MSLAPTEPLLVVSDLHLGHRASRIKDPSQLSPILREASTVVFNGDTAEMRHEEDRPVGRRLAADLAKVCHSLGTKAIFVNGNHDPTISNINHLDLAKGAILVTHGDILFMELVPWSRDARKYRKIHEEMLGELGPDAFADFEKRLLATKRASLQLQMEEPRLTRGRRLPSIRLFFRQVWPPTRPFMIMKAWWETPGFAANLARIFRPRAKFIVVGHTHSCGHWRQHARVIINTGSFIPWFGCSGMLLQDDRIEIRKIVPRGGKFVFGRTQAKFSARLLEPSEGW
jgi:predicted phosphodiesterase